MSVSLSVSILVLLSLVLVRGDWWWYCKSTHLSTSLPAPMYLHKVLHQYLSANTFNCKIRLRMSVFTVHASQGIYTALECDWQWQHQHL
jgi:hypothetical protein